MFVPRMNNKKKEPNHIKHMYCPICKEKTSHIEVREDDELMPVEYYLRKPINLGIQGIQAYCSGEFLQNGARILLIFIMSNNGKKYLEFNIFNTEYFKNRDFTKEEIKEIRTIIHSKRKEIILDAPKPLQNAA